MNNNQFVETYYNDIRNACSKYYNMISSYVEFEDFLQEICCIFLKFQKKLTVYPDFLLIFLLFPEQ